jgi:hypothetical protein
MSISIIVWLNKKLILIDKVIKYNQEHVVKSNILIYIYLLIF